MNGGHVWFGTGLKLGEFLQLPAGERRPRFYEMSDVDQLLFVERHLDPFVALLEGYPPESMLPEITLYGHDPNEPVEATVVRMPLDEATEQGVLLDTVGRILRGFDEINDEQVHLADVIDLPRARNANE